jgi:monoamine oxidase
VKYIFRVDAHPNLLAFFLIGRRFQDINFLTNVRVSQDITWLLRRFINPNLNPPNQVWRTSWIAQQNFRGAYSYMSIDTVRHGVTPALLGESVMVNSRPTLLFAGEATDKFYGYANGALTSGYRAAEEILSYNIGNRLTSHTLMWFVATVTMILMMMQSH